MAQALSPRQEDAYLLLQVRLAEYCEVYDVPVPPTQFQPDLFDGHTRAVYMHHGIAGVRSDCTLRFYDPALAYDTFELESVLAHEFLHYLENREYDTAVAAGEDHREAFQRCFSHVVVGTNRKGRWHVVAGDAHGQHAARFYSKQAAMVRHMDEVCPIGVAV